MEQNDKEKYVSSLLNHIKDCDNQIPYMVDCNKYCECGKKINNTSERCVTCARKARRTIHYSIPLETLLKEVNENSYVEVGHKYGVTDNCIRKWIKNKGGEPPKKQNK
jgi:hypothetical protein